MKRHFFLAFQLLMLYGFAFSQIKGHSLVTKYPRQYERVDWIIQLTGTWVNPYLQEDVSLDMYITSPSGKSLVLPCYHESGASGALSNWKARFNPQEKGKYIYRFIFFKGRKATDSSDSHSFAAASSAGDGILHQKNNWILEFDNGKPFRGIGENIGWESRASDDSKFFKNLHEEPKYNYEYMLRSLASHGGNFFRTWICAFNLPIDWKHASNSNRYTASTEYYNPSAVAKMDRLVDLCDSLHLHMMLTLGQGAYQTRDGGYAVSAADFFINPKSKLMYKNRLRYFVARWGYSSSIGAWEFFNEVDNVQFSNRSNPINAGDIAQWHDELSTYLKQLDPYHHVVTTSISHRDIDGLNSLPNIDINQKHIYKNTANIPSEIEKYEATFNKPYVIGEYSYEWDWSKNFNLFTDGMDSDYKRGLWYGLFSSTPILPLSWWWEFFDDRGTDRYISKVRMISDQMLKAGKGHFEKIEIKDAVPGLKTLGLKSGKLTFIYIYNPSDSLKSVHLTFKTSQATAAIGDIYNPGNEKWSKITNIQKRQDEIELDKIELTAGSDLIFIIGEKSK